MKEILYIAFYGAVEPEFYAQHRAQLRDANYQLTCAGYGSAAFICTALFAASFLFSPPVWLRTVCGVFALFFLVGVLVLLRVASHRRKIIPWMYILFATAAFAFSILLCMADADSTAFFVLLIIVPVLYCGVPWKSMLLALGASLAYVGIACFLPSGTLLSVNSINCLIYLPVSCVLIAFTRNLYLQNLRARSMFEHEAQIDKLTGVLNKAEAEAAGERAIKVAAEGTCALLVLDIDNFKAVNDTMGHTQGDEVLRQVGAVLKATFREKDILGRIGGDEFVVVMRDIRDKQNATKKASDLLIQVGNIFSELTTSRLTVSIGIALNNIDTPDYTHLFACADKALYLAKNQGKGQYCVYSSDPTDTDRTRPMVLIADDSAVSRAVLCSAFENEYSLLQTDNGRQTLELMRRYADCLCAVLLDVEMPGMTGYEVLAAARDDALLRHIPIIVVTAYGATESRAMQLGAVDVVEKPFDAELAKPRVQRFVEQSMAARQTT